MVYEIEVRVRFRYGHRLSSPYKGKCNNVHGEGGTAILIFEGEELNGCGMLVDFGEVKKDVKLIIDELWDHAFLYKRGDVIGKILKTYNYKVYEMRDNPTAENMAKELYDKVGKIYPQLKRVGIVESFEDSIAWYKEEENNEVSAQNKILKIKAVLDKFYKQENIEFNKEYVLNPYISKGVEELTPL